ncbi:MAG: tetratricopeptide repeat protein, partial [Cyclonatronaceae bacterium]
MILSFFPKLTASGLFPAFLLSLSLLFPVCLSAVDPPGTSETSASMHDSATSSSPLDARLQQAIQLFYESDWEASQHLLDELQKEEPENPTAFFFDSMMPFWAYFFAGERSEDARRFLERSEKAISVSEKRLKSARNDTSAVLLLSGLHGYRSLVAANESEYRTAIRSAMTGFNYTRQLLSMDSDDPNAQMGRGVFNYMMCTIPKEVRWVVSFSGMSG